MSIVIDDPRLERLAQELAAAEGTTVESVVRESLMSRAGCGGLAVVSDRPPHEDNPIWIAVHTSDLGSRAAGAPRAAPRVSRLAVSVRHRAWRADDAGDDAKIGDARGLARETALPHPPSQAAAFGRLQVGERRPGYPGDPAVSQAEEHHPHGALHGIESGAV